MAKIRLTSPTFDASAQTVTHPSFSDVTLSGIQLIVNVTDQVIIYNFADTAKGGALAGDVLTLEFNTTTMSDTDELMVLVEDGVAYQLPTGAATAANQASILAAVDGIEALLGTIDADTGAILLAVDTLETLVASTNTKLDTVIGHVDGIEATLTAIEGDTSAIQTAVDGLEASIQTQGAVYTPGATTVISGVRQDVSGPPSGVADGDVHPFIFNSEGRLKVASQPAQIAAFVDNITSNGDTVSIDVSLFSNLTIYCTGTFSTVNVTFEASINGGTNWFTIQGVRSNANTVETATGNLSAAPAYAWEFSVNAYTNFRVRATAFASGTQVWTFQPGTYATEPIPAVQVTATQPVSLTSTTITSVIPTTAATALGKARDSAIGATDTGVAILGVRRDAPTAETPVAGDYVVPQISANGEQWVRSLVEVADDGAVTLGTQRGLMNAGVSVQTDGTDPTAVSAEGDAAIFRTDMNRILLVNQTHPRGTTVSADYASAQTNTSVIASPGASLSIYITDIQLSNGATAGNVTLLNGSAGTVLWEAYPAINGGAVLNLRQPIKLSAATALCITSTTVTTHSIFIGYYIAA